MSLIAIVSLCAHDAYSDVLVETKRAMRILNRIATAAGTGFVKPAIIVGKSRGLASYSSERKLITIDSGMFRAADRLGEKADDMLATIIGHEFAHYVRGHNYNDVFQHKFGGYASIRGANSSNSRLLLGKQDENEADYFGMYYALLAGFDVQVADLIAFQAEIRKEFGFDSDAGNNEDDVHQTDGERAQVAKTVIEEMRLNVLIHYGANIALMSGEYLQAAVLFEYVSRIVNIPSVNWNELLARYLHMQQIAGRQLIDPKILRMESVTEFRYRSSEQYLKLDIEQFLFRCRSLVEMLKSSAFNVKGIARMERLIGLFEDTNQCSQCVQGRICATHKDEGKRIEDEFVGESTLAGEKYASSPNTVHAAEMMKIGAVIDEYSSANKSSDLVLSIGRGKVLQFDTPISSYLRIEYSAPKSRAKNRIDIEIRSCSTCEYSAPVQQDNLLLQNLGGKVIRAATFVN